MNYNQNFVFGLGIMRHNQNQNQTNQIISYAIQNGINYFEACDFYLQGECENRLSMALSNFSRQSYYLCDKFPLSGFLNRNNSLEEFFNNQLKKCNTNYFDVYLIQAIDRYNLKLLQKNPDIISFFNKKRQQGIIKNLGFSFHDNEEILQIVLDMNKWDIIQLQLNYYDWYLGEGKKLYFTAKNNNLPIIVMGPCKGGLLTKGLPDISKKRLNNNFLEPAHLCYKFLSTLSSVKIILSGAENIKMLENNLQFFKNGNFGLTQFEKNQILLNIEDYKKFNFIQCTNCKYCINNCQKKIPINEIFYNYNVYLRTGDKASRDWLYDNFKSQYSISKCQKCGACERICPQHLPIQQLFDKNIFPMRL